MGACPWRDRSSLLCLLALVVSLKTQAQAHLLASYVLSMHLLARSAGCLWGLQRASCTPGNLITSCSRRLQQPRSSYRQQQLRTMASSSPRGAFIVFEGADRAGKSTQCQMLVEHLQQQGVRLLRSVFPKLQPLTIE